MSYPLRIEVLSRAAVEDPAFAPVGRHGIVSFFSPRKEPPRVPENAKTLFVAQHAFDDVHAVYPGSKAVLMSEAQAGHVARKIVGHLSLGDIETLYFQCDGGIARSAGGAGAVHEFLHGTRGRFVHGQEFAPNPWVHRLVLQELRASTGMRLWGAYE